MKNKLLNILEQDSRLSTVDLADMLAHDIAVVESSISELEHDKIICGYHTLINWDKTNVDKVTALIEVKVTPEKDKGYDKIAQSIYQYPEVSSMYLISGGHDFTVIVEGKSMKEVAMFVGQKLAPINGVSSTATSFVLKRYKEFGITLDQKEDTQKRGMYTP